MHVLPLDARHCLFSAFPLNNSQIYLTVCQYFITILFGESCCESRLTYVIVENDEANRSSLYKVFGLLYQRLLNFRL